MSKNVNIKVHEAQFAMGEKQMEGVWTRGHEGDIYMYGRESGRLEETEEQQARDLYLLGNIVRAINWRLGHVSCMLAMCCAYRTSSGKTTWET